MNKSHEVEYRALLNKQAFDNFYERGQTKFSASFKGPLTIEDIYFCEKEVQSFSEVEMDEIGSYSLRLRQETHKNKTDCTLNMKVIQNYGDHNGWLEHEIDVSSFETAKKMLAALGFKPFFQIKKDRYSFDDGNIHVCLEDIEDFQPAIEVEIVTNKAKIDEAKEALKQYLINNEVNEKDILKKSITNLLMKERSKF